MTAVRRFSFSLLTLFLVIVIAALIASQAALMRRMEEARKELAKAQQEVAHVRKQFGYIKVTKPQLVLIARIESGEIPGNRYRMIIPPGVHYMLHITDSADVPASGFPDNPQPTETMSMNSWRNGADVVLRFGVRNDADGIPRLDVATDSEELFSYRIEGWQTVAYPNSGYHLQTDEKQSFSPDEVIRFMTLSNDQTKRGVMLWMEPVAHWNRRRGEQVPAAP
jgi:hypothetical protein